MVYVLCRIVDDPGPPKLLNLESSDAAGRHALVQQALAVGHRGGNGGPKRGCRCNSPALASMPGKKETWMNRGKVEKHVGCSPRVRVCHSFVCVCMIRMCMHPTLPALDPPWKRDGPCSRHVRRVPLPPLGPSPGVKWMTLRAKEGTPLTLPPYEMSSFWRSPSPLGYPPRHLGRNTPQSSFLTNFLIPSVSVLKESKNRLGPKKKKKTF